MDKYIDILLAIFLTIATVGVFMLAVALIHKAFTTGL